MDGSFLSQFIPEKDNFVFSVSGIMFALGWWAYVFGVSSPSGVPDHPYQFDATSLLPGFMATLALIACKGVDLVKLSDTFQRLNLFSTRRQLYVESWNMFATSTSRMAKLFVFILFCLNLGAIGFTVVLGVVGYGSHGMPQACQGMILQVLFIIAASFTIYFGRVLSDSQFFEE